MSGTVDELDVKDLLSIEKTTQEDLLTQTQEDLLTQNKARIKNINRHVGRHVLSYDKNTNTVEGQGKHSKLINEDFKRINLAKRSVKKEFCALNVDEIDLTNTITKFPVCPKTSSFFQNGLKHLNLSHNSLKDVPKHLERLQHLEYLDLSHNQLKNLPSGITKSASLKTLLLQQNQLRQLPEGFGRLDLVGLDLSENKFEKFPTELLQIDTLNGLNLRKNSLKSLPDNFGSMTNLIYFDLSQNELDALPLGIDKLKTLQALMLSENNISELPVEMGNLEELRFLHLISNNLETLPKSLKNLTNLMEIHTGGNKFIKIPDDVFSPNVLKNIRIFPYTDRQKDNLNIVDRLNESILEKGEFNYYPFEDMVTFQIKDKNETIDLNQPHIKDLFCELDVTFIDLWGINTFPSCLKESPFSQSNLKVLQLSGNQLKSLPKKIKYLEDLELINLENNPLSKDDLSSFETDAKILY